MSESSRKACAGGKYQRARSIIEESGPSNRRSRPGLYVMKNLFNALPRASCSAAYVHISPGTSCALGARLHFGIFPTARPESLRAGLARVVGEYSILALRTTCAGKRPRTRSRTIIEEEGGRGVS